MLVMVEVSILTRLHPKLHVSHSLNSLKGVIWGNAMGDIKGDARSLDNGSCAFPMSLCLLLF